MAKRRRLEATTEDDDGDRTRRAVRDLQLYDERRRSKLKGPSSEVRTRRDRRTRRRRKAAHPGGRAPVLRFHRIRAQLCDPQGSRHLPPIPVSVAKELQVELPPGLVGNPLNAQNGARPWPISGTRMWAGKQRRGLRPGLGARPPQPSLLELVSGDPFAEAVNGKGTHSSNSSRIYDIKPSIGHPAEFGFKIETVPFVLEAKVRSDGDYGVTVGDAASGRLLESSVLGVKATFCGYGVERIGSVNRSTTGARASSPPPRQALPHQPHPVLASSAVDPEGQLVGRSRTKSPKANRSPPPSSEPTPTRRRRLLRRSRARHLPSLPLEDPRSTGCDKLSFEPQLSLEPTTTQADEPTGLKVDLKIPQTNSAKHPRHPAAQELGNDPPRRPDRLPCGRERPGSLHQRTVRAGKGIRDRRSAASRRGSSRPNRPRQRNARRPPRSAR